jgi:hypothetical protein
MLVANKVAATLCPFSSLSLSLYILYGIFSYVDNAGLKKQKEIFNVRFCFADEIQPKLSRIMK